MKSVDRQKIDELLQPIMKIMQKEFPNNCKLIVEPYFSQIVYEHTEMVFPSDEMKQPLCETSPMKSFAEAMNKAFGNQKNSTENT